MNSWLILLTFLAVAICLAFAKDQSDYLQELADDDSSVDYERLAAQLRREKRFFGRTVNFTAMLRRLGIIFPGLQQFFNGFRNFQG
ncbi:Uncharacterised protein g2985 [Pycnogonum litorale]